MKDRNLPVRVGSSELARRPRRSALMRECINELQLGDSNARKFFEQRLRLFLKVAVDSEILDAEMIERCGAAVEWDKDPWEVLLEKSRDRAARATRCHTPYRSAAEWLNDSVETLFESDYRLPTGEPGIYGPSPEFDVGGTELSRVNLTRAQVEELLKAAMDFVVNRDKALGESLLGSKSEAIDIRTRIAQNNPEDPLNWDELANAHALANRRDDAIAAYERAVDIDPNSATSWESLGYKYESAERYEDAIIAFCRVVEIDPNSAEGWYDLGRQYESAEQWGDAIDAYCRSVKIDPNSPYVWHLLGESYTAVERHDEAIDAHLQAIAVEPKSSSWWEGLGNAYTAAGRHDEAINAHSQVVEFKPNNKWQWSHLGNAYRDARRYSKAVDAYRRAVDIDPNFAECWSELGKTYVLAGCRDEAIDAFSRALDLALDGHGCESMKNSIVEGMTQCMFGSLAWKP